MLLLKRSVKFKQLRENQGKMIDEVIRLKTIYKLECLKSFGKFQWPMDICVHDHKIFIIDRRDTGSEIVVCCTEDGEVIERFGFKEQIRYINVLPGNDFLIYSVDTQIFRFDMKTRTSSRIQLEENSRKSLYSIKLYDNEIFILDIWAHTLIICDLNGRVLKNIDLSRRFEFPLQFCRLQNSNQILLTRNDKIKEFHPGLYNKYKTSDDDPGTNIACYDTAEDTVEYLPGIPVEPNEYIYQISTDKEGNIFLNTVSQLIKLDSNFNEVFFTEINRAAFGNINKEARFFGSAVKERYLFISEMICYKTLFKFSI